MWLSASAKMDASKSSGYPPAEFRNKHLGQVHVDLPRPKSACKLFPTHNGELKSNRQT